MHYVYLLFSARDNGFYVGYSSDLRRRFREHCQGKVKATKQRRPLTLVYYEAYNNEKYARQREKKLKAFGSAYHGLLKRLKLK